MHQQRRFPVRSKGKFGKRPKRLKIKPGADAGLKKVFASIGVPDKKKFKPDPFQLKALEAIEQSDCLVTAPTGAGKTWIAEKAIARIHEAGGKSWYASPLKALTNAKYSEFSKIFGTENLGILTGDRKENSGAPIMVGTTEILRNQLYDAMHQGVSLAADLVILDEAHFLGDEDRGVVWEEIMIYLPVRIPLLMLSATIGNANHIARWLESIRAKECSVIEEKKRPVPLFPLFFHPSGTLLPMVTTTGPQGKTRIHKKVNAYLNSKLPLYLAPPNKLPPFGEIMRVLKKYRLLPAIFFLKSRIDCDNALTLCTDTISQDQREKLRGRINELAIRTQHITGHHQLWHLENLAVGAHHSGQLPAWKLVLETLMSEGHLDAIFATSTVAAGVNFPARSIVLLNSDRFNGKDFLPLSPTEFHQMTGRAGRRGMDRIGFAVVIPGKFMDLSLTAKLVNASPSDVTSQIRINFSMVLNLLLSHKPDQIEDLLSKSFAAYTIRQKRKEKKRKRHADNGVRYLKHDFMKHLEFLKDNRYVTEDGTLTDDGIWASRLRVDQPLRIAEGFRLGIFPESDPALLASVIASFVNEQETNDRIDKKFTPDKLLQTFLTVTKSLQPFSKHMIDRGFEISPLFLRPAATIYAWAGGQSWEKALLISEIAEGDLAMLILRTADNLRHIRALELEFPEAARTASKSIDLIMRDPMVMHYTSP